MTDIAATDSRQVDKMVELVRGFDTVMLATLSNAGFVHSRPMAVAAVDDSGEVWFVTSKDTGKVDEIDADSRAVVTGQDSSRFVSMSGHVDLLHDAEKIRALWRSEWKVWFPKGQDDPSLVLLRLRPEVGEYWDQGGLQGLRYIFQAAKALASGERAQDQGGDPDQHAKVAM